MYVWMSHDYDLSECPFNVCIITTTQKLALPVIIQTDCIVLSLHKGTRNNKTAIDVGI